MCNDPRIAGHVRTIANFDGDVQDYIRCQPDADEEQRERCRAAAENTAAVDGLDLDTVTAAIESTTYAKLLCVFMQICPRVKELRFVDDYDARDEDQVFSFLSRVVSDPKTVRPGTLANLKTACIAHWDTEGQISSDYVTELLRIPSLQTITGQLVGTDRGSDRVFDKNPPTISNLTRLEFTNSLFKLDGLRSILAQIHALETFVYGDGGAQIGWDADTDLCGIIAVVQETQGHSLLHLEVMDDASGIWPDGNLSPFRGFTGFQKLRYLRTELLVFAIDKPGEDEDGFYCNADFSSAIHMAADLPHTLEELYVNDAWWKPGKEEYDALKRFVEAKQTYTPAFRKLIIPFRELEERHITLFGGFDKPAQTSAEFLAVVADRKAELERICEIQGVELEWIKLW